MVGSAARSEKRQVDLAPRLEPVQGELRAPGPGLRLQWGRAERRYHRRRAGLWVEVGGTEKRQHRQAHFCGTLDRAELLTVPYHGAGRSARRWQEGTGHWEEPVSAPGPGPRDLRSVVCFLVRHWGRHVLSPYSLIQPH